MVKNYQDNSATYLFVYLSEVNNFLYSPQWDEPEDSHIPALANTVRPAEINRYTVLMYIVRKMLHLQSDNWNKNTEKLYLPSKIYQSAMLSIHVVAPKHTCQ